MKKKLLLLVFSAILFVGCSSKEIVERKVFIKTKCPYVNIDLQSPKTLTFTFKNKNGKIVLEKEDFRNIMVNYVSMRQEINATILKLKEFNKTIKRINDGN